MCSNFDQLNSNLDELRQQNEELIEENRKLSEKLDIMCEIRDVLQIVYNSCDCHNSYKTSVDHKYKQLINRFEQLDNNQSSESVNTTNKKSRNASNETNVRFKGKDNNKTTNRRVGQKLINNSNDGEEFKSKYKTRLRSSEKPPDPQTGVDLREQLSKETESDGETTYTEKVECKTKTNAKTCKVHGCFWPGCEAVFRNRFDLQDHIWRHSGEKSFVCSWPECGKQYANKRGLVRHLGVHEQRTKFKCDWPGCQYNSLYAEGVKVHKRRHTDERAFRCSWPSCECSFRQSHHLKTHLLKHTGEKPFTCDLPTCDKRFQSKQAMKCHYDRAHKI